MSGGTDIVDSLDLVRHPSFMDDPHPLLARLRDQAPVCRVVVEGLPVWLVTRYDDVRDALSDARLSNDPDLADAVTRAVPWVGASPGIARHLLRLDPPDHTRLRRLVARAFTPRRLEALRPRIQQIVDGLIAAFRPRGRADLVAELALPLPLTVISELLGVSIADDEEFAYWIGVFFGTNEGDAGRLAEAHAWFTSYLTRLVEHREREHAGRVADVEQGSLLDGLIAVRDQGEQLRRDELIAMAFLLLLAGYDTTASLIGNGMLGLLQHPDQYAALRADPSAIRPAIEEFLRHDGPVKLSPLVRFPTTDVTIGGTLIPAHQPVLVSFAAANRDPAQFSDPDRLDLSRREGAHLGFGHGVHFCLGAPLARLEAEVAFTTLLAACPDLALEVPPAALPWRRSRFMRALKALPVTFAATPARD